MLSVPFAFHSFQMDPILQEYKDLASGVAYLPPKIPVASTLLASIVDRPGVFSEDYLAMQTRQAVDFCGGLNAIKSVLKNPDWLEIGPGPVCTSFVRASLNPPSIKINHSIDAKASNWASISKTLANAYASGVNVDWHGLHAPYENNLRLLSLPTYAWDVKDYWITHTEERHDGTLALAHAAAPSEPFLTSSAQYLVEKTLSPKVQVTFRAGISDHGFTGVIDGHKMQQIGLASGSVFSDAAATVAKYALEYSGRKNVTTANLTFHDPELLVPLTRGLVGVDGTLFSTAIMESGSADNVMITFKASSARGDVSHDLGSMRIHYRSDPDQTRLDLDRVSYFIRSKMEERIRLSKEGTGHRIQPDVFYALFANAVEFSPDFRGVQEAYVSSDFEEAAAAILLPPDPVGTRFTSSPYWAEALLHLAGFMVNGNPSKPPQSTFVVMGYESVKQLAAVEPGKQYQTYTRITRWEKGSAYCAAYVFDTETSKIVMQAVDLRYQEFKTATWRHILDGPQGAGTHRATSPGAGVHKSAPVPAKGGDTVQEPSAPVAVAQSNPSPESNGQVSNSTGSDEREFTIIIDCLAAATGSDRSEFTDDTTVGDIGVDSIMAIEVVAAVKEKDVDLPAGFIFEYPTIGDLRRAYGGQEGAELGDDDDASLATPSSHDNVSLSPSPEWDFALISTPAAVSESSSSLVNVEAELAAPEAEAKPVDKSLAADPKPIVVEEDTSPLPSVRITLLQGRPKSSKTPIYMIADGTGTVASFIHFQPFKSKQTVYGVDSPYFRCPSRMTSEKVGIEGVAKLIVEALVKARPTGPLQIGGYSAGCLVAFEVSRQLAAAGRSVEGLLLIDMCCPRSRVTEPEALLAEDEFSYAVFQEAVTRDSLWSSLGSSRAHFRAFFVAMNQFTPETMTTAERPAKTVIIWSERGLVNRVSNDPVLMQKLADQGVPTKPYPGFLEDPKLGTFACLVPDKGGNENLGSNGWERYTNGEVMALSVAGDHFELMMPGHVHLLQAQMEKAFKYFSSN
jgi:iterative type I PKS product template protein